MARYRKEVPPHVAAVIKLARSMGYPYTPIASFFCINFGGIADVMMERIHPEVPPASRLPDGFPPLHSWRKAA